MQYRINQRNGDKLSVLGYGCLRYTKKAGKLDVAKAEEEMLRGLELGINYFDTAYVYRGSEELLGNFLAQGYRSKVFIATKLPHYQVKTLAEAKKIFQEELRRLRTDYLDYYLLHMLNDVKSWERLCELGIKEWLESLKSQGIIKNLGFSYHGGTQGFKEVIDAYNWDFCQIQFNYMDEYSQAGREGLNYAAQRGLPVFIMEPLRGGRLTEDLPSTAKAIFAGATPQRTPAQWGLRWLWNESDVTLVLSGMNDLAQVEENCKEASVAAANCLGSDELAVYDEVKQCIAASVKVTCTGCSYCMPCPQGVDIPNCLRCYNISYSDSWFRALKEYFMTTTLRRSRTNAGACVSCGKCRRHCPQGLDVPQEISRARQRLENPVYKVAALVAKHITKF